MSSIPLKQQHAINCIHNVSKTRRNAHNAIRRSSRTGNVSFIFLCIVFYLSKTYLAHPIAHHIFAFFALYIQQVHNYTQLLLMIWHGFCQFLIKTNKNNWEIRSTAVTWREARKRPSKASSCWLSHLSFQARQLHALDKSRSAQYERDSW